MASSCSTEVSRLRSRLVSGELMHPYISADYFRRFETVPTDEDEKQSTTSHVEDNFVDLAASIAMCCGVSPQLNDNIASEDSLGLGSFSLDIEAGNLESEIQRRRLTLASEIGGKKVKDSSGKDVYSRKHVIFILCDGMGNNVINKTVGLTTSDSATSSFFVRNNQPRRLRAVFPSTTPAALTTLATATWPGRHGMPGWNLRDKKGCDLPGQTGVSGPVVQLRVLAENIIDDSSGKMASELGFESWDEVFVEIPWARKLSLERGTAAENQTENHQNAKKTKGGSGLASKPGKVEESKNQLRRMIYINAYNGDEYQNWSQGENNKCDSNEPDFSGRKRSGSDFSEWQMGKDNVQTDAENHRRDRSTLFETAKIEETAYDTLGKPKGSADAVDFFSYGINTALRSIAAAEKSGDSTFTYLYTAHPDKHMHTLGVEHDEVKNVVRGIEREVERFWRVLGDREALLSGCFDTDFESQSGNKERLDASIVVTADHGHITVRPEDMIVLPDSILACLEYANVGVWGTGRHAYLHCRAGLQNMFRQRWQTHPVLLEHFILLTVEEAIENGLFGPSCMRCQVRPRLGDFIAISTGMKTLVKPSEADKFKSSCRCQGAHGSLLPDEMSIPFVLLVPPQLFEHN